jgi:serine/threonine protein kinase/serine/threonine protein phosphatase PrpC
MLPREPLSSSKGVAIALADGISSSSVSQVASETSVKGFLEDYYSTSESWSVRSSVQRVLHAANSWLYSQTRNGPYRYDIEKGYVCTFSALVLKSATAHLFNAGDARIYRLAGNTLEQLTQDHRVWLSADKSYLSRALGMRETLDLDYHRHAVDEGDVFILTTDGVHEFVQPTVVAEIIAKFAHDLDKAAKQIVDTALAQGSDDNLTVQIARVDQLGHHDVQELQEQALVLPYPPQLQPRMSFDGYLIVREMHHSPRSHVYLAVDEETGEHAVLKTPSVDMRDNHAYLESFLMEEWVAKRVYSVHLLQVLSQPRKRNFLYIATEFVEGKTLRQWMLDNPAPEVEVVRGIVEQIAKGLQVMHRQEMLHQDLRPENIMIDSSGTVKIIDFGSTRVAGVAEIATIHEQQHIRGTLQYTAPEYLLGEAGSIQSDIFSLGVIAYEMLSGSLPYGANMGRAFTRSAQQRIRYCSVLDDERTIPLWVDEAIHKAVQPQPLRRYAELSEFLYDLRQPNPAFLRKDRAPLLERNPILFWQGLSLILFVTLLALLATHPGANGSGATVSSDKSSHESHPPTHDIPSGETS